MMKKIFPSILFINSCYAGFAQQGVGINNTSSDASAMLDVKIKAFFFVGVSPLTVYSICYS